jgi:hypothetical protein
MRPLRQKSSRFVSRGALCLRRAEGSDGFVHPDHIARAKTKIGPANLVYKIKRLLFLRRIAAA